MSEPRTTLLIALLLSLTGVGLLLVISSSRRSTFNTPIKIGVISPLTGSAASYGEPAARGVILAAELINQSGGVNGREIQLIVEDGKCDGKEAAQAATKLIEIDNVNVILGGHCSSESLAIAPIANKNKVIQLATITSSDAYTNAGDYSFRNWPTSDYYVGKLGSLAHEKYESKKISLLYELKDFPLSVAQSFKKSFEKEGGSVVSEQSFPSGENDLRAQLSKISQSDSDSIFFASQGDDAAILFFKQLKEMGILSEYKLFSNNVGVGQKVFKETNGLNTNVITTDVYVDPEAPKTKTMLEAYKKRWGEYPQTNYFYVASSYDGVLLISDAVKTCGEETNTECIKNVLYSLEDWKGTAGTLTFDENGDAVTQIALHYFKKDGAEVWEQLE